MSKFLNLVFNVTGNPDLSRLVQLKAFELGYKWGGNQADSVSYTGAPFLFLNDGGYLTYSNFDNASERERFDVGDFAFFQTEPEPDIPSVEEQIKESVFVGFGIGLVGPNGVEHNVTQERLREVMEANGDGRSLEQLTQELLASAATEVAGTIQ